jgi:hypothetical protein
MVTSTLSLVQKRIYSLLNKFKDLHNSKILDDDSFFKELFILAYELGKEDYVEDAITMLQKIDIGYFSYRQMRQAEEDPIYNAVIISLKEIIKSHKEYNVNSLMPNVPPGEA